MKVLALHGRYQCAKVFSRKLAASLSFNNSKDVSIETSETGEVRFGPGEKCEGQVYIFCLDAPNIVEPKVRIKGVKLKTKAQKSKYRQKGCETRAWWEEKSQVLSDEARSAEFQSSIDAIRTIHSEKGPFDGILGFSQGASLAALLCTNSISSETGLLPKFSILCSGYLPSLTYQKELIQSGFLTGMKHYHLMSENDMMVIPKKSLHLSKAMGGEVLNHGNGHSLPSCAKFASIVRNPTLLEYPSDE
mmetsp:Transcript_3599/g.4021  ORF Transcript_3599/g.4021 Transcript_3599/m.4021 type:complete len:247 (+) Transcript_3599:202-942(+)